MSVRSLGRKMVERMFDVRVIPPGHLPLLFEQQHLRRFFAHFEVDCVFDVGANQGQYAKMVRTHTGYNGPIISYEPNPVLAAELRALAKSDPAWFIEELALGDTEDESDFNVYASDAFSSLHTIALPDTEAFRRASRLERRIKVRVGTAAAELERYRSKLGFRRPFLKMDTQGHDLFVAKGAGERLREFVGLQSELSIERLYQDTPTYHEAIEFFLARGFAVSALVPNNLGHFPRLLEIDCILFREG